MKTNDRTFGIEIEFGLKRTITEENFKAEFEMRTGEQIVMSTRHYNTPVNHAKWTLAYDGSVRVRNHNGRELKSPPIKLSEIHRIKKVYDYLNEVGKVNRTCGQHVHIDCNDMTFKQWKKVLIAYLVNEDVIDMMHPVSRRFGSGVGTQYCGSGYGRREISNEQRNRTQDFLGRNRIPISSRFGHTYDQLQEHYKSVVINECIKKIKKSRNIRELVSTGFGDKYSNVCFKKNFGTIEFRQHAGTLEEDKIINWINFLNQFVIAYGFGPSVAKKDETRTNGRDRLFFRKVSQLFKSTKNRMKTYGGFNIDGADRSFEYLGSRISHFIRKLNSDSNYDRAMRKVLEDRGVTFNLRGGNDETNV